MLPAESPDRQATSDDVKGVWVARPETITTASGPVASEVTGGDVLAGEVSTSGEGVFCEHPTSDVSSPSATTPTTCDFIAPFNRTGTSVSAPKWG